MRSALKFMTAALMVCLPMVASAADEQQEALYTYRAIITDVYDGDTVTADIDLGFNTWRRGEHLRLVGIDAPEVRGAEKAKGFVARDALRALILNREVILKTIADKEGKYGRMLARIYVDNINVNAWMMMQDYAIAYE